MREIKFRAWDNENKRMYKPTHEAYRGKLFELMVSFGGDLSAHTMKGLVHESMWPKRYVLMQYTGLKDKNGKEIYEGDVIRNEFVGDSYTIEYSGGSYNVNEFICKHLEVIGNIYENEKQASKI